MLCCPRRLPFKASSRFAGGTLRSVSDRDRCSIRNFRKATCWMSDGSLEERIRWKIFSVSFDLKDLIMSSLYNA